MNILSSIDLTKEFCSKMSVLINLVNNYTHTYISFKVSGIYVCNKIAIFVEGTDNLKYY